MTKFPFAPRDYQLTARHSANSLLNKGDHPLLVMPTGTGKTKTAAMIISDRINLGETVYIIAPQIEIFEQLLNDYSFMNPGYINDEGIKGKSRSLYVCMALSLVNIIRMIPESLYPNVIITDECLTGDSKIITSKGLKGINKIKVGDSVLSSDSEYHKVYSLVKKETDKLYIVKLKSGEEIRCTANHPIYTYRGFIKAKYLKSFDMVQTITYNQKYGKEKKIYTRMQNVWCEISGKIQRTKTFKKSSLFNRVRPKIQKSNIVGNNVKDKREIQETICRQNDSKQSYEESGNQGEGKHKTKSNGTQNIYSGRKRKRSDNPSISTGNSPRMGNGNSNPNKNKKRKWLSDLLQSGHREQSSKNSNRSRRKFSHGFSETISGQEKRFSFDFSGVESIEIQKQEDRKGSGFLRKKSFVYDINVEDSHNYFANGILVHNCHHSAADTWESIYYFFGKALRIGMTATPVRTDNKPLGHLYTEIVEPITIEEAIKQGFLTPPIVIGSEEYINLIPDGDEIDEKKQAEILGETKIVGDLIEAYERVLNGLPMLIACCTFDHAKTVRDSFRDAGWIADHVHSGLSKNERKSMLSRVHSGKTNILTTVGIGIEGFDCSGLHGLAYLRKTVSTTIFVQFNGRPMRLEEGKKNCYIFDFVGNCVIHGMPDRIRKWSLTDGIEEDEEDKPPWQKCPDCGVYNHISNTECHYCGADLTEEGRKEGTCRRCKNWRKGKCKCVSDIVGPVFCPIWLILEGCSWFTKKGRSLPATIDGELVAINTDREISSLKQRADEKKEEQRLIADIEEKKRLTAEPIDSVEKRKIIQKGLFADQGRRSLFRDALEGYR